MRNNKVLIDDSHMWNISCSPKIHDAFVQLGAVSYDGAIKQ